MIQHNADERLHALILRAIAQERAAFAASASSLHRLVARHLSRCAALVLSADDRAHTTSSAPLRLAVLACFHRFAQLSTSASPVDIASLHDFIIVYFSPPHAADEHAVQSAALARKVVADLLLKKPSLARALETQVLASYIGALRDVGKSELEASGTENRLAQLRRIRAAIKGLCIVFAANSESSSMRDLPVRSSSASSLWSTVQLLYDTLLPTLIAPFAPSSLAAISSNDTVLHQSILAKRDLLGFFASHLPRLGARELLGLLEGEASAPDLPVNLSQLPLTSYVNVPLLADAEHVYEASHLLRENTQIAEPERAYIANVLANLLPGDEQVHDALDLFEQGGKGKGSTRVSDNGGEEKARRADKGKKRDLTNGAEAGAASTESSLIAQIQAILPDTPPELIQRLLSNPSFAGLPDQDKVENAVGMILEGHPDASPAASSGLSASAPAFAQSQSAPSAAPGKSAFAQARRNVFDERLDVSKLHMGKQDIANDSFLPDELKAAIMYAAEHADDSEDEDEEEGGAGASAAFIEDLGGDEQDGSGRVRVKDDVDEESDAEEEAERHQRRTASGAPTPARSGAATPALAPSGLFAAVEARFLALYLASPATFARDQRRTAQRAELKRETQLSDEQIEGWARMLERNPRKDKILAKAGEFRGNRVVVDASDADDSQAEGRGASGSEGPPGRGRVRGAPGGGRGRGGPGRGGGPKGGRGHQSDARRRGNDRKMAKQGGPPA